MPHGPNCPCISCWSETRRRALGTERQDEQLRVLRRQLVPTETVGARDGER